MKQHLYKEKIVKSKRFPKGQYKLVALCGSKTSNPKWIRYITNINEFRKHYKEYNHSTCEKCHKLSGIMETAAQSQMEEPEPIGAEMKEEHNSIKFDAKVITDHFYGSVEIHNGRRYDDNLTFVKNKLDSQYQRGRKDQQEEFIKQNKPNIEKLKDIGGLLVDVYNDMDAQRAIIESELQSKLKD